MGELNAYTSPLLQKVIYLLVKADRKESILGSFACLCLVVFQENFSECTVREVNAYFFTTYIATYLLVKYQISDSFACLPITQSEPYITKSQFLCLPLHDDISGEFLLMSSGRS